MSKSTYLGLELTDDDTTLFKNWREAINSSDSTSNAQIIDTWASNSDNTRMVTVSDNGAVSQALSPNVFYDFTGTLTSLTITLSSTINGRECEYKGQFLSGSTAPTVTFPNGITWVDEFPTIEANKTYQFSILNNIGIIVGV